MPPRSAWKRRDLPFDGVDPAEQYKRVQWGRESKRRLVVEVPGMLLRQVVIVLGYVRALGFEDGREAVFRRPYPFLMFGADDNRLYGVPREGAAFNVPDAVLGLGIVRTDYDSWKGGSRCYYFHDHEPPYPYLVRVSRAAVQFDGGGYVVLPEGITG